MSSIAATIAPRIIIPTQAIIFFEGFAPNTIISAIIVIRIRKLLSIVSIGSESACVPPSPNIKFPQ